MNTVKVSLYRQRKLAKAGKGFELTIFPCLFAMMNEMRDDSASLGVSKNMI